MNGEQPNPDAIEVAVGVLAERVGPIARVWVTKLGRQILERGSRLSVAELEEIARYLKRISPMRAEYLGRCLR